jgi:hypothetical protein
MAQDRSGNKPKKTKSTTSDIPPSLSDARGTGGNASGLTHYRSGQKPPDWEEWKYIPVWHLREACALSMNIDPHSLRQLDWAHTPEPDTYDAEVKQNFSKRLRILEANWEGPFFKSCGRLDSVHVVQWQDLPPELVAMAQQPENRTDSQKENGVEAAAPAGKPERNDPPEESDAIKWKAVARRIASEIHSNNPRFTVEKLADKTHKEMTAQKDKGAPGMTGRGGKIPSAGTIKRHALTRIKA